MEKYFLFIQFSVNSHYLSSLFQKKVFRLKFYLTKKNKKKMVCPFTIAVRVAVGAVLLRGLYTGFSRLYERHNQSTLKEEKKEDAAPVPAPA
ncbi:hypothetical protein AGDE_14798 [Angomonas deanei]|uniref:Uncharacterized protein n=1 Tax=Angomonas deanei TaxID=59799 RepID=A0A7G2CN20_9TRYP|nr:hypothetical protein AGDE_14798 [Angomonas deanei]CAD2221236.1 hypothetical protein, conserved [Angomonas deanei]|eukprot:EPY20203.1 hypothetical protein AGDE_14798 [Angomonas deanei]